MLFSASDDYVAVNKTLTFASLEKQCLNVSIVNDNELENEEEFSLTLTTMEDRVRLDPDSTTVRITDDDGKAILSF